MSYISSFASLPASFQKMASWPGKHACGPLAVEILLFSLTLVFKSNQVGGIASEWALPPVVS